MKAIDISADDRTFAIECEVTNLDRWMIGKNINLAKETIRRELRAHLIEILCDTMDLEAARDEAERVVLELLEEWEQMGP